MLVHCRGGVGRAGVIACCWLVRLGLCGWSLPPPPLPNTTPPLANIPPLLAIPLPPLPNTLTPSANPLSAPSPLLGVPPLSKPYLSTPHLSTPPLRTPPPSSTTTRASTIAFVERVVALVRRRRSAKAIETYEQVRFIVEYVEYLQSLGTAAAVPEVGVEALSPSPSPLNTNYGAP